MWKLSQTNLDIKFKLVGGGYSPIYLIIGAITVIYFISVLAGYSILSAILAFPAVYIAPGLLLILLVSGGRVQVLRQLIILSFFLSTIIAVIIISLLILFNAAINAFFISIVYLLLNFVLITLLMITGKAVCIQVSRLDYIFLGISFIAYAILVYLFTYTPRFLQMDETSYITWSRYVILKGEVYPIGSQPAKFDLTYLVKGRFFWTLLIASFICATGLTAYQSYIMSSMFLPMIALTSTLLIPSKFKEDKILEIVVFTLILTNPLLILFSGFILNDLAISFYLLLAILFFVRSFNQNHLGEISLNLYSLFLSLLTLIVAFLVKENVMVAVPMYFILIFYILCYRLYKVSKVWKVILCILTLPLIAYEVLIDIPYVISVWFTKNEAIAALTGKFLFISPVEQILGLFVPAPWKPTTIFSYNFYDYLHYMYRMLSPETLSLVVSGVGIALPLTLTLEEFHKDIRARLLIYITTITLWLSYVLYLSINAFWDIPRYFLFMTPILITISLAAFYEMFSKNNVIIGSMLILPMVLLLWIQSLLVIKKGGVYVGYGLPKLNWTNNILIVQIIICTILILVMLSVLILKTTNKLSLTSLLRGKKPVTNIRKYAFITLIITIFVINVYFSAYSILNSSFYKNNEAENVNSLFGNISSSNIFVISNFYAYMRPYAPDHLIKNDYLFPPPMTEEEFREFLRIAPNNTLLIISNDPDITWYEYGNKYIKRYTKTNLIPLEPKRERVIYNDLLLDLRLGDSVNGFVYDKSGNNYTCLVNGGRIVDGFFGNAIQFDGEKGYALINDFEFPDEYSVEIWFMLEKEPANFGFMEDGRPVSKMLLAKRYHGYAELMLSITNEGEIQALAKNENNDVRFNFKTSKGLVEANRWYQVILTVDKQSAKLYLNGVLVGESVVKGLNQRLKDYPESREEPLRIGADGTSIFMKYRYFPGRIEDIRIYKRSLTDEEIAGMYYGPKLLNIVNGIKVFKVKTPIQLHIRSNNELVNITSVKIYFTNATNVRVTIKANSAGEQKIFIIIGTIRFLKALTANLKQGQNELSWDFKARLEDRSAYGLYIANMAKIIIYDENGNLLYDKMHSSFTLSGVYLFLWILILLLLASFTLFLSRKF
jgi:hypothetical protein